VVFACAAGAFLPVRATEPDLLQRLEEIPTLRFEPSLAMSLRGRALGSASTYRPAELVPQQGRRTIAFYDTHLLPRLNSQFQAFRPYENMPGAGQALEDYTLRSEVAHSAEASAVRGATKAARDFFLDMLPVDRWFATLPRPSTTVQTGHGSRGGKLDFSFGISHAMPEVGMRYRVGSIQARFDVDSFGAVDLEFMRTTQSWTRVALQYRPVSGWYGVHWRLSF
jgi:hypothetical protein